MNTANTKTIDNLTTPVQWARGMQCKLQGKRGVFRIVFVYEGTFPSFNLVKIDAEGNPTSKPITGVTRDQLLGLDEDQPTHDKYGRTAFEAATELCKSGFVMTDYYNTTSERLAKVEKITPSGRITVRELQILEGLLPRYRGEGKNKVRDDEVDLIDYSNLQYKEDKEALLFTPKLFFGEWRFWHKGSKVLEHPKLTKTNLMN